MSRQTKHRVGAQYGDITIIECVGRLDKLNLSWRCLCKCGQESVKRSFTISSQNNKCYHGRHHRSKAVGDIPGSYWSSVLRGAHQRGIEVNITPEYANNVFVKQNRKCALTGLSIDFKSKTNTASLDRRDSSKGYDEGNVWWVHKDINRMKSNFSTEHFTRLCELVSRIGVGFEWDAKGLDHTKVFKTL